MEVMGSRHHDQLLFIPCNLILLPPLFSLFLALLNLFSLHKLHVFGTRLIDFAYRIEPNADGLLLLLHQFLHIFARADRILVDGEVRVVTA